MTLHQRTVVAIGLFDGVHRGHQAILRKAVRRARARRAVPVTLTFYPHPAAVIAPWRVPRLLLSLEQRLAAFARCGIRKTHVVMFTRAVSRWSPGQFVDRVVVGRLAACEIVVGHDFRFGHRRQGTIGTLRQLAARHGIRVHVVAPVRIHGIRVSSRIIRRAIDLGRITLARRYLGRPPTVAGRVVRGAGRGKRVGIPTANLDVTAGVLPPTGVYAVWMRWGPGRHQAAGGVANLGWRPTVDRRRPAAPILEVHAFHPGVPPLRGRPVDVAFGIRLRPERRFPSFGALVAQIRRDQLRARRWLATQPPAQTLFFC